MSYDSYKIRLGIKDDKFHDRALAMSKDEFARNIIKSPNYKSVLLEGTTQTDAIITEYSYTLANLDKKKLSTTYDSSVNVGNYVRFDGANWLVVTSKNYTIDAYKENIIERCNLNPLMYKVGNFVYSDFGVYQNKTYVNQFGNAINVPKDNIDVKLPLNTNTKKIKLNDIFYIFNEDWYEAYRVASIDRSYYDGNYGILGLRAEMVDNSQTPEQYYNLEPISETVSKVVIIPSSISPTKGDTTTLIAKAYDNLGVEIVSPNIIWSSSNPSIATVVNGEVTAVEVGTCQIIATVDDLDEETQDVYGICGVNVVDGGGWF